MATSRKKWTPEILGKLERGEATEPSYQEKVNALKDQLRADLAKAGSHGVTPNLLAHAYRACRSRLDEIEESRYAEQMVCTALEQMLQKSLLDKEVGWGLYGANDNAIRMADGATVSVDSEPAATVVDPEEYRKWCIANGLESKMALHPSTTNSLVKERLHAGMPLPAGTVAHIYDKVKLTKPRKNKEAEE